MLTVAMSFPVDDWQFWVATALVLVAAVVAFRAVVPIGLITGRRHKGGQRKRVSLTIGGEKPGASRSGNSDSGTSTASSTHTASRTVSSKQHDKDCGC